MIGYHITKRAFRKDDVDISVLPETRYQKSRQQRFLSKEIIAKCHDVTRMEVIMQKTAASRETHSEIVPWENF